jgi:uncharacterized protein YdiU (UPF0061 family)
MVCRPRWQAKVRRLADYVIDRHYREVQGHANPYLGLLEQVCDRQAALIASWMQVGFIHGVMNTDNMAISGETIDYGPCAFMDHYDPATVFSSIDTQGRYAYANQPRIAQWNLARLAETLVPLIDADRHRAIARATEVVKAFPAHYERHWLQDMRAKLGRKRNKKVSVVMICSPIRGTLEGAMHHGLRVTHRCREGRYQQPRGYQAGHDHQLRYSVSNIHWRAGTAPCRTDSPTGKSTKYSISGAIALA